MRKDTELRDMGNQYRCVCGETMIIMGRVYGQKTEGGDDDDDHARP